ncbi:hypothetical protein ABDB91_15125 [Desulfoscipio sp. XC116]|uniref:hypothetical protein n=1 Tax=Desulfoscipio sp. XC116 TaxID=3144975 RepID=UPI00325B1417
MQISQFVWDENIIEHIAGHNVTPEEIEEVCFGYLLIIKSKQAAKGINPIYYVLGQTDSGRHLFIVIIYFKQGRLW